MVNPHVLERRGVKLKYTVETHTFTEKMWKLYTYSTKNGIEPRSLGLKHCTCTGCVTMLPLNLQYLIIRKANIPLSPHASSSFDIANLSRLHLYPNVNDTPNGIDTWFISTMVTEPLGTILCCKTNCIMVFHTGSYNCQAFLTSWICTPIKMIMSVFKIVSLKASILRHLLRETLIFGCIRWP